MRIYWTEDFSDDPSGVVHDALAFVGADPSRVDLKQITSARYNARSFSESKQPNPHLVLLPEVRKDMEAAMRPFNQKLANFLGVIPPWMKRKTRREGKTVTFNSTLSSTVDGRQVFLCLFRALL